MVIGYLIIAFIIFFFMYKKYGATLIDRSKRSYDPWIEYKEFWIIALVPILWVVAIPMYLFWNLLEKIYKKYFNDNNG